MQSRSHSLELKLDAEDTQTEPRVGEGVRAITGVAKQCRGGTEVPSLPSLPPRAASLDTDASASSPSASKKEDTDLTSRLPVSTLVKCIYDDYEGRCRIEVIRVFQADYWIHE